MATLTAVVPAFQSTRLETAFETHGVSCVILDLDPLVIYGASHQTWGIAFVFLYIGLLKIEY